MRKQTKFAVMLASVALLTVSAASIVSAKGWVQQGGNWYYQNADGDFVTEEIQASGNSKFYLGEDGAMVTDYFLESYGNGDNSYYFGSNGAMVTNTWVAVDPSVVSNQGDYVPDAYWYYFQGTGKAVKGTSGNIRKITIDGKKYAFNENGQMLTGWIDSSGNVINPDEDEYPYEQALYYAGADNDGVLHSGWLAYYDSGNEGYGFDERNVMYFYFNTSNNKKVGNQDEDAQYKSSAVNGQLEYVKKKINGRNYAFHAGTGVMLIEWEGYATSSVVGSPSRTVQSPWYFSGEEDGHRVQKGWIYAVPAEDIDKDAYDDQEEKYMYFQNNGDLIKDQIKKINGKYYAFDNKGIMKTGLVLFANGRFATTFDSDNTNGDELAKIAVFRTSKNEPKQLDVSTDPNGVITVAGSEAKIHYFGPDGSRRTGSNQIEMSDDDHIFSSSNTGNYDQVKNKKYYSNGMLLKASSDIRYGLWVITPSDSRKPKGAAVDGAGNINYNCLVLNTSGAKVNGSNSSKKDADGNYWLIDKATGYFKGIWTVQVRDNNGTIEFKGDKYENGSTKTNAWISGTDATNKTLRDYAVEMTANDAYALNFCWTGGPLAQVQGAATAFNTMP